MRPGGVNDVMHRKHGLRILGIWEKAVSWVPASKRVSWDSELGEARRICALWAPHIGWVESWWCKSSQHRKTVSLSHVEKPLNSKRWIKVSYLNLVFSDSYICLWTLFHISISWACSINGISTLDGYLMPNPIYTYTWFLNEYFIGNFIFKQPRFVCTQLTSFKYCCLTLVILFIKYSNIIWY